jgi:hypothetical protein
MYTIDNHIPAPEKKGTYPFGKMDINDSFLVPAEKRTHAVIQAAQYKRRHACFNYCFKDEPVGRRIWRIQLE